MEARPPEEMTWGLSLKDEQVSIFFFLADTNYTDHVFMLLQRRPEQNAHDLLPVGA